MKSVRGNLNRFGWELFEHNRRTRRYIARTALPQAVEVIDAAADMADELDINESTAACKGLQISRFDGGRFVRTGYHLDRWLGVGVIREFARQQRIERLVSHRPLMDAITGFDAAAEVIGRSTPKRPPADCRRHWRVARYSPGGSLAERTSGEQPAKAGHHDRLARGSIVTSTQLTDDAPAEWDLRFFDNMDETFRQITVEQTVGQTMVMRSSPFQIAGDSASTPWHNVRNDSESTRLTLLGLLVPDNP